MTLTIAETGVRYQCKNCDRTIALLHNGMLFVRNGKEVAAFNSGSIQCRCGHWNHVTVKQTP